MKKLTKTQKQNLKKKLLRTFNIIGLIVGGLSFIVVLYAIIAGGLAANNSENTTAEVSEDVPAKPTLEQRALPAPGSYDLELSAENVGPHLYYFWQSSEIPYSEMLMTEYTGDVDYYSNIHIWRGVSITINVYSPTTPIEARPLDFFVSRGDYIGGNGTLGEQKISITIVNASNVDYLVYFDLSCHISFDGAGAGVRDIYFSTSFLDKWNNFYFSAQNGLSTYGGSLLTLTLPARTGMKLISQPTNNLRYGLSALYLTDMSQNSNYINGYDHGEGVGYDDGYDDGYGNGRDIGEGVGYNNGYDVGYDVGYDDGVGATIASTSAVENAFDLIYAGAQSVDKILSISIFGSISLGMLLFTPLIVGISLAVIKVIKG